MTIPGIYTDAQDEECVEEAREIAEAIMQALKHMPQDRDVDETLTQWPFKDWNDLLARVDEVESPVKSTDIGNEAKNYFVYAPEDDTLFKIKITGESMGMSRTVEAEGYVNEKTVRYVKWRED